MYILQIILSISVIYLITAFIATVIFFKKHSVEYKTDNDNLPLSVLKPLHEYNEGIDQALQSTCSQDYPIYQIIFGIEKGNVALLSSIQNLCQRNASCDIELVQGVLSNSVPGSNGKVRILCEMYRHAKYDTMVISDSDMLFTPQYLRTITMPFSDSRIGLVTCLYKSIGGRGFPAALEAFAIDLGFIPSVMVARLLGNISFAFGATMAIRREVLEKIGGLESLRDYLADDYLLGNRVYHSGYKIFLSNYLVDSLNHIQRFKDYFFHQLRWARTYRICRPYGYFFSFITHTFTLSLLFALLSQDRTLGMIWVITIILVRCCMALGLTICNVHSREYLKYLWALPVFDILQSIIWALAFLGNTVVWSNTRFRVHKDGKMTPLTRV